MAEIKIEKKKSIWPWILLVIVLLGLIWYFFLRDSNNRVADETIVSEQVVTEEYGNADDSDLAAYSSFIADTSRMGVDHEYSNSALNHLIDAVEETADKRNVDLKADLDEARENASEITEDPEQLNHANLIKDTGKIISRALSKLQAENFPNLSDDAARVDSAVNEIDPSVNTLDQKDKIHNFFKSAESLLIKMQ